MAITKASTGTGEANIGTRTAAPTLPPELPTYPDKGEGLEVVTLVGLLHEPAKYRVGKPVPQDLTVDGAIYNLSDRATATYTFRHP